MKKIRKDDEVIVIAGRDKGKTGTVMRVQTDDRLVVSGVNMVKRHTKPNPTRGVGGGIVEKEMPIQISNVALLNPITKRADKVAFRVLEDGRKVRYFKSNNEVVDI
ncbi:MAG: rplX [Gammaproteobacteria bacterium]|nr:MAG: rplX [Gammaproteobacteria bacterium]TND06592.1 MAG: rplX [Gammaproteobacteria bacterium]